MPWVYIDDKFDQHPKVVRAGSEAAWVFVAALCWVNRNGTAGHVPHSAVRLLTEKRTGPLVQRLLEVGLWEEADGGYAIHDYEFWNRTAMRLSERGKKAAQKRWDDEKEAKLKQNLSNAQADAQASALQSPCADTRAGSLSLSPSPKLVTSPSDLSGLAPDVDETIEAKPRTGGGALVERLTSTVATKGAQVRSEAIEVIGLCRQHVADELIDEAIGYMATLKDRPKHPQYLLGMIPQWAEQRGVHGVPKLSLRAAS